MKNHFLFVCKLILIGYCILISPRGIAQTYNYKTALLAFNDDDTDKALDYFEREVLDHPQSKTSYYYIAAIHETNGNYTEALRNTNKALLYAPKNDFALRSKIYALKGDIEYKIGNTDRTFSQYAIAIQLDSKNINLYFKRAQYYFELNQLKKSELDYKNILAIDEFNEFGWYGLARNYFTEKKLDQAEKVLTRLILMNSKLSYGFKLRAQVYFEQQKYNQAIVDMIRAIELDQDDTTLQNDLLSYSVQNYTLALAEINEIINDQPFNEFWNTLRAKFYNKNYQYKLAIKEFDYLIKYFALPGNQKDLLDERGNSYTDAGLYYKAINDFTSSIAIDSTDSYTYQKRAIAYRLADEYQKAILDLNTAMQLRPKDDWNYYMRGWIYDEMLKDTSNGFRDYNTAISLNENEPYYYLMRGRLYNEKLQNTEKATEDFLKILNLEKDVLDEGNCRQYALFHLGRNAEAITWLDQILKKYPNAGNYYDASCLYALMNKSTEAIKALRISFEKGNTNFKHIAIDDDIDSIRNNPEFIALIKEWSEKVKKENGISETADIPTSANSIPRTISIPLSSKSGVFEIPCKLNDLKLDFIFDTGASDISISKTELNFMLKNNYLSRKDFIGHGTYTYADGSSSRCRIINIKKVEIGSLVLYNVQASVVENQKGSLLFGQTALSRYGQFTIDNKTNTLHIQVLDKIE